MASPACIVIGIGNRFRSDDGVGPEVAAWLRDHLPEAVQSIESDGEPATLISRLEGADAAWLIDACRSGAEPGTIHRLDVSSTPLPQGLVTLSTHGVSIASTIELARALDELPARCIVYAVEAASFETGGLLTPSVADAVKEVGRRICAEMDAEGARAHA